MSKLTRPYGVIKYRFNANKRYKDNLVANSMSEPYYGRIDSDGDIISLSEHNLKQISTIGGKTYWAVNFVTDAFEDFRRYYNKAINSGRRPDIGELTNIEPEKAWVSGNKQYHDYMQTVYTKFFGTYINRQNRIKKILTFKDFLHIFTRFVEHFGDNIPLTKSGYVMSNFFHPHCTGLMIKIKSWDSFSLIQKENFLKDPNFEFYSEGARKFGFKIDKRTPWRLIADLSSPAMLQYASDSNLDNVNQLFEENYFNMYQYDIDVLKAYLKRFYDTFMTAYPWTIHHEFKNCTKAVSIPSSSNWTNTMVQTNNIQKFRWAMSEEEYDYRYGTMFWMRYYLHVRAKEVSAPWTKKDLRKKFKKALELYKGLDIGTAMRYINAQIKLVDSKRTIKTPRTPIIVQGKYIRKNAQIEMAGKINAPSKQAHTNVIGDY